MSQRKFVLLPIALLLMIVGCATTRVTNLTPAYLQLEPSVQSYKDLSFKESEYRTFSVFASSLISDGTQLGGGILEKQMLFVLRNAFEELGYKFVELNQSPDFLVTIDGSAQYKEIYVPPQTLTVPHLEPGRTITTYDNTTGSFNYNTYGDYSSCGWGTWSGSSVTTSYIPGYITTETYTSPGYYAGAFYPSLSVSVFDGKSLTNVWTGIGTGTSNCPDFRISSQFVLKSLLRQFPPCPHAAENLPLGSGQIGIWVSIYTNDGNNYFPTVIKVVPGLPAEKAGIKVYDMILSIDGITTQNKPLSEVMPLIRGDIGSKVKMSLWRVGKRLDLEMARAQRQ